MSRRRRRPPPTAPEPPRLPWDELYPSLDLHGETADSARRIAERWLRAQQVDGVRTVRVITGRGRRSIGPPVLRGEIADLLHSLRGTVVSAVTAESRGGAFRVELCKPRRSPRAVPGTSAPPPRAAPPPRRVDDLELRRRAEESLAELGVHPTQLLIEAEMRRLREDKD